MKNYNLSFHINDVVFVLFLVNSLNQDPAHFSSIQNFSCSSAKVFFTNIHLLYVYIHLSINTPIHGIFFYLFLSLWPIFIWFSMVFCLYFWDQGQLTVKGNLPNLKKVPGIEEAFDSRNLLPSTALEPLLYLYIYLTTNLSTYPSNNLHIYLYM